MRRQTSTESGFSIAIVVFAFSVVVIVGAVGWYVLLMPKTKTESSSTPTTIAKTETKQKEPDSASTINSPQKIATKDGKQYFYYGAPAGQNNASPKKILITLHGTEGSAEKDYEIWKPSLDPKFALASLNWWDGSGEQTSDYSTPEVINTQIHEFLSTQGYTKNDVVVLEGFSRGSANSYSVVAHDRASTSPLIDVAVSSSGGSQDAYYQLATKSISTKAQSKIFTGVYWILACGNKDPNPSRDGCEGMEKSKAFVTEKGAVVLGLLSDPNAGHGALNTSKLNLTKQMFDLINQKY